MSSFIKKCKNPKTGKEQVAFFIDDFYGMHQYGVGFPKDGSDADFGESISIGGKWTDYCDFYKEEEIKLI